MFRNKKSIVNAATDQIAICFTEHPLSVACQSRTVGVTAIMQAPTNTDSHDIHLQDGPPACKHGIELFTSQAQFHEGPRLVRTRQNYARPCVRSTGIATRFVTQRGGSAGLGAKGHRLAFRHSMISTRLFVHRFPTAFEAQGRRLKSFPALHCLQQTMPVSRRHGPSFPIHGSSESVAGIVAG
jgi:hypothetical protein